MHPKNSIEMRFCVCVVSFILAGATYAADLPSVEVTEQARVSGDATAGPICFTLLNLAVRVVTTLAMIQLSGLAPI